MGPAEFLQRVLPDDGTYCGIVIYPSGAVKQRFFDSIEDLAQFVQIRSDDGDNVYYAPAAYKDSSSRKQVNVESIKSFYLDIDCGEGKSFASQRDGAAALVEMCREHGLPKPTVVSSGNGLHVYWILDEAIAPAQWRPIAEKLKRISPDYDPAVTADSARVLRVPGTINPKGGKTVKVLYSAQPVTLEYMRDALRDVGIVRTVASQPASSVDRSGKRKRLDEAVAAVADLPPADPDLVAENCANIRWAVSHQDEVQEPLWYALLGVAAYCEDYETVALKWSKEHPGFSEPETLSKVNQWKERATGPATCAVFEQHNPSKCEGCPFAAKISSPIRLGIRYQQASLTQTAPDAEAQQIPVPAGFKRIAGGFVTTFDKVEVQICDFDIYPVSYGHDEILGYEVALFRWNRPHVGWQSLRLRQALLAPTQGGSKDFATSISDQGILLNTNEQVDKFKIMLRGYLNELRKMQTMTNMYATMGWKDEYRQFVLGDKIYRKDTKGKIEAVRALYGGTQSGVPEGMFAVKGTFEAFSKMTLMLEKAKLPYHNWMFMVGMSAVLYEFTGIHGAVINLYGPTGSGKTLAQLCQQSVWGDPRKLHFSAKTTSNALYQRMGVLSNLPLTMDEATMINSKELGDFVYSVSQGRDKARLTRTAEARDPRTWSMPLTTSSNKAFGTMLVAAGLETDAQLARLIDIQMHKNKLFADSTGTGTKIYTFITNCYGHLGPAFLEYTLTMGADVITSMIVEHKEKFAAQYDVQFAGHERFWEQVVVLADFCGMVACEKGWMQCDYTAVTQQVLSAIGTYRSVVQEQYVDAFDILSDYLTVHMPYTLTVLHTGVDFLAPEKSTVDLTNAPRGSVYVRYDIHRRAVGSPFDRGYVYLDRNHFKRWLSENGLDYRTTRRDLTIAGATDGARDGRRISLGKQTSYRMPQRTVICLNLMHPRLVGILKEVDDRKLDADLGSTVDTSA